MTLPTITPVEPPVATTLWECISLDIVQHGHERWVLTRAPGSPRNILTQHGYKMFAEDLTPVLIVARVQLEGRGK